MSGFLNLKLVSLGILSYSRYIRRQIFTDPSAMGTQLLTS